MSAFVVVAAVTLLAGRESVAVAPNVIEQQEHLQTTRIRREICYVLATGAVPLNLADCLGFGNAPEPVFRAEVCNFLRETGQLEDFGLVSHSECVRDGFGS